MKREIKQMIGKSYLIANEAKSINDIEQSGDVINLYFTDGTTLRTDENELLNDFKPVVNVAVAQQTQELMMSTKSTFETMDKLTEVLMNTITKVQDDPDYVDQANAINNSVKQVIDITKQKIDAIRLVRDMQ